MNSDFAPALLAWYAQHARRLPWRNHPDPYAVWVSEIMLQQTRVETVIPYFERWMARFPTLAALASAPEQDVLHAWEGLGYYSRARNLRRAAQIVLETLGGRLPTTAAELEKLPGVGKYTAAAIASMAFGQDEAALDANIRRVIARVFAVTLPARSPAGEARIRALAQQSLPTGRAGDFNQALMDLGATICLPHNPACLICPIQANCLAFARGIQESLPVLEKKAPVPHYTVTAAVIQRAGLVLIARRPSSGLLGGLWEFPGGKLEAGETLEAGLRREIREELGAEIEVGAPFGVYQHGYTHFKVTLHAFLCTLAAGAEPRPIQPSALAWVEPARLGEYPMGKIDRKIAERVMRDEG